MPFQTSAYSSVTMHTLKLPKHIGLVQGKNWATQYDSLFVMKSDEGRILFWQLTSGTAYCLVPDGLCRSQASFPCCEECLHFPSHIYS